MIFIYTSQKKLKFGYTMNRYLLSTYYGQSSLGEEPFMWKTWFFTRIPGASVSKEQAKVGCTGAPDTGEEKMKEEEAVSIWRATETWGEREIPAIVVSGKCISYLLLCNKFPQIWQLKTTRIWNHAILCVRILWAAGLGGSGLGSLTRLQCHCWSSCSDTQVPPGENLANSLAWLRAGFRPLRSALH